MEAEPHIARYRTPFARKIGQRADLVMSVVVGLLWSPAATFLIGYLPSYSWNAWYGCMGAILAAIIIAYMLPAGWFKIRRFERSGRLYRCLGIRFFKSWMVDGDRMSRYIRRRDPSHAIIPTRDALAGYILATQKIERAHLGWLLLGLPPTISGAMYGHEALAIYLTIVNVSTNVYPVILQRYNRSRAERVRNNTRKTQPANCCLPSAQ